MRPKTDRQSDAVAVQQAFSSLEKVEKLLELCLVIGLYCLLQILLLHDSWFFLFLFGCCLGI